MASKLYPPILEASIPAFYGQQISIPFKHNPLVASVDFSNFVLQVKKINGELIGVYTSINYDSEKQLIYFNLNQDLGNNPNWYKFQIAYQNDQIGYYSTVAVGRYLGMVSPTFKIHSQQSGIYKAIYNHPFDPTEKAYSYHFVLKDNTGTIIEDTGEQIHNINEDEEATTSVDFFEFKYNLTKTNDKSYYLHCTLVTINGLVLEDEVRISDSILSGIKIREEGTGFKIFATLNRDNGSVELTAKPLDIYNSLVGKYVVRRVSSKDNYLRIQTISRFSLFVVPAEITLDYVIKLPEDRTVEAGYYYKYFIQRINSNNLYSNIIGATSQPIYVSFDDCFLSDGERQLCIKYNPKISSFKTTIQEAKLEAIGSKYPYIMRNGKINYKEFPISGLISLLIDENNLFMTQLEKERLGVVPDKAMRGIYNPKDEENAKILRLIELRRINKNLERGTPQNLVDININAEKEFKIMVLDFLNNGKPKLFRSATEGNFCVYTMNSSLSPNDTLGRMLHTFSCTAYEIQLTEDFYNNFIINNADIYDSEGNQLDENGLENAIKYNKTISITDIDSIINKNLLQYNEYVNTFSIRDANPLAKFKISFENLLNPTDNIDDQIIQIGSTGSYNYFNTRYGVYIKKIALIEDPRELYNSNYFSLILRDYIKVNYNDFDYLVDYQSGDNFGNIISYDEESQNNIVSYLPEAMIQEDGTIIQSVIDYLYLFRVQNRNTHKGAFATYFLDDSYLLSKEYNQIKGKNKVAITEQLANFLEKQGYCVVTKMTIDERAAYIKEHVGESRNVTHFAINPPADIVIPQNMKSILIPPSTTVVLARNLDQISNITVFFDTSNQEGKDLYYEICSKVSTVKYNYGG